MDFFKYDEVAPHPDVVLILGTIDRIPERILNLPNFKVGLSWAYDLYRDTSDHVSCSRSRSLAKLDRLIVDCDYVARLAVAKGFPESRIINFPYGVDLDSYRLRSHLKPRKTGQVTFYTNRTWRQEYGIKILLEGFRLAQADGLEFTLKLAGDGQLRIGLMHEYRKFFDSSCFEYVGEVTELENRHHLELSDFYVSASLYDGFSVSILESMAIGVPVIASDIEPNKDLIRDNEDGFLFSSGNSFDLSNKLFAATNIYENQDEIRSLSESAREKIEIQADFLKNLGSALSNLYDDLA